MIRRNTKRLIDVCEDIIMGQSPDSSSYNSFGKGLPFFQGKTEFGDEYPTAVKWCSAPKKIAKAGDILISVRAPVGATNVAKEECCIGRGLAAVRVKSSEFNRDFLLLQLKHLEKKLVSQASGSTFEAIGADVLYDLKIYSPDIKIQEQVATSLMLQLNAIKKARKAAEEQKRELKFLLNTLIEKEIIDCLEGSNNKIFLGEVIEISSKLVNPTLLQYCDLIHVSAENIQSVSGHLINLKSAKEDGVTSGKYKFDAGDVLYSKLRPYLRKVALPDFDGLCSADMYPLKCDTNLINSRFLKLLLTSNFFTNYANEKSARSRMPKLNRDQLYGWEFCLPSLENQNVCLEKVEQAIQICNEGIKTVELVLTDIKLLPSKLLQETFEN